MHTQPRLVLACHLLLVMLLHLQNECVLHQCSCTCTVLLCANVCLCAQFKMEDGDTIEVRLSLRRL